LAPLTDEEYEDFLNHPLNCKEITPEMLERPEYQALQQMAYEGNKVEVAQNFLTHATNSLSKVLLEKSVNKEKDLQEALHCLNEGLDQKCGDNKVEFALLMNRAKLNLFRHNFGHCKDDCLQALKIKQNEQVHYLLCRTRLFVEKYDECVKCCRTALEKFPNAVKIKDLMAKANAELEKEKEYMRQVQLIN
jgi:tetratricopeptide (TPR) repeat protein